jgi:hypothetical protein
MLILHITLALLATAGLYLAVHTFELIWVHSRLQLLALPHRRQKQDAWDRDRLSKRETHLTQHVTGAQNFCTMCIVFVIYAAFIH